MKIYLKKIDEQCINKQISYPKDIIVVHLENNNTNKDFIGRKMGNDIGGDIFEF